MARKTYQKKRYGTKTRSRSSYRGRNTGYGRRSSSRSYGRGRTYSRRSVPQTVKLVIEQVAAPQSTSGDMFTGLPGVKAAVKARL